MEAEQAKPQQVKSWLKMFAAQLLVAVIVLSLIGIALKLLSRLI